MLAWASGSELGVALVQGHARLAVANGHIKTAVGAEVARLPLATLAPHLLPALEVWVNTFKRRVWLDAVVLQHHSYNRNRRP